MAEPRPDVSERDRPYDPARTRLHVVTGKGGTGKTTVAAALALALASGGRRVLLCEVEGRQGIAQLLDIPPLPYEERRVATGPGGGEVYALAVDTEAALIEYLDLFYNLKRAAGILRRVGAIEFATTIAPGLSDVLLTGKIREAVERKGKGSRTYDAVVVDAPPTGRIGRFLNVTAELAGLAKVGPLKGQADSVMRVLKSNRTAIHLVTLLEEMPVQETIDAVAELTAIGLPVGAVIVNAVRQPLLSQKELVAARTGRLGREGLKTGLTEAHLPHDKATIDGLVLEAADHALRVELEARERQALEQLNRPTIELPKLNDDIDLGGLYELADRLMADRSRV